MSHSKALGTVNTRVSRGGDTWNNLKGGGQSLNTLAAFLCVQLQKVDFQSGAHSPPPSHQPLKGVGGVRPNEMPKR